MSYFVSTEDVESISLNETDTVKSVLQNIRIIFATFKRSVPLYRNFGLNNHFKDRPINVVKPLFIADMKDAIEEFEPRAEVLNIKVEADVNMPGKLKAIVEVDINE